ncbi:hypothetical protein BDW69DRAFT_196737 [Aspergillus filifer]
MANLTQTQMQAQNAACYPVQSRTSTTSTITTTPKRGSYDSLASLMASDKGLSIFRSFKRLNAKNLSYYQAEIVNAEAQLQELIDEDRDSNDVYREKYHASVRHLKEWEEDPPAPQWKKFLELRALLEKYNTALLQHAEILRLKEPHVNDREVLRAWLDERSYWLNGEEHDQWFGKREQNTEDLITLAGRYENVDPFTKWWIQTVIPAYHARFGYRDSVPDPEMGTVYYDDEKIKRWTRFVSTIVSSVIPATSMIALYLVKNMIVRLVLIIIYNIAFSVILGFLTKARRVEVFAASTAFAAVQVAFITNFPGR